LLSLQFSPSPLPLVIISATQGKDKGKGGSQFICVSLADEGTREPIATTNKNVKNVLSSFSLLFNESLIVHLGNLGKYFVPERPPPPNTHTHQRPGQYGRKLTGFYLAGFHWQVATTDGGKIWHMCEESNAICCHKPGQEMMYKK
jgi:hypothetical protein